MDLTPRLDKAIPIQLRLEQQLRFRQMRVLLAVVDFGGASRAAEQLGVTQTAVSKVIAEIEAVLAVPIFARKGRGLGLTKAGLLAANAARRITAEMRVLGEDLDFITEGAAGTITIGLHASSAERRLVKTISELIKRAPRASVKIRQDPLPDLYQHLRAARIDLLIGRMEPALMGTDMEGFYITNNPTVVGCTRNHPVLALKGLDWKDVSHHTWILQPPGYPARDHFDHLLDVLDLRPPRGIVEINSASVILQLTQEVQSLTLAPRPLIQNWADRGAIAMTSLTLPSLSEPVGLIWPRDRPLTAAARQFRQILIDQHDPSDQSFTDIVWAEAETEQGE
jgi:DNA-binding transcriptional LysR family regulator